MKPPRRLFPLILGIAVWLSGAGASSALDASRAVSVKNVNLNAGLAKLRLDEGVVLPASPVGGKTEELVFLGKGRITLDPPDDIEAAQLDLFTGEPRLDEEVSEIVLVVGLDAAVEALLRRPPVASLDPAQLRRGEEIFEKWRGSTERKAMNVDGAILMDTAGDPLYQKYFAGWFHGKELGDFLYLVDPEAAEQVTLGHFVPLEATEREKRKILKEISRQQRRGRLIGVELDDLGQWDTWLSASLRGPDGKVFSGVASFEPEKYSLDVKLEGRDLRLSGRARIDLKPVVRGARAVSLRLQNDLQVTKVADPGGQSLTFSRTGDDLVVLLPHPMADNERAAVVVEYSGSLVEKTAGSYALRETSEWYPHAGNVDRALYDVTFHWPKKFGLVSCGRRIGGGEEGDGMLWERRALEQPAAWFSFEVGKFRIETSRAGHVDIRLAFDPTVTQMGKETREEITKTVGDSLLYFEELYGPYPLDEITIVTVPRGFSQASLGFVALSSVMMLDLDFLNLLLGLEDRRTVIAHEVAHQWWGHMVGWSSDRDQWISEAMASYSALLYGRNKLDWKDRWGLRPTTGWQKALLDTTPDGRPIESIGPLVLGRRLLSSRAANAYQPIVYQKGPVVLDMLARSLGQDDFPKVLRQIVKVAAGRSISTEDFMLLIERITSTDLSAFAHQYIYGTGLPEVYYTFHFTAKPDGKWTVAGTARQQTPYRFRYRVAKAGDGRLDVVRERLDQIAVQQSTLVVPIEIAVYDPSRPAADTKRRREEHGANAVARSNLLLRGETSDFSFDLDQEPKDFWLDRHEEVFGRFFNESRAPKRILLRQGTDAAAAGKPAEAEALFRRALEAEVEVAPAGEIVSDRQENKREARILDGAIQLQLARLALDQGEEAAAQEAFDKAHKALNGYVAFTEDLQVIESRLDLRHGEFDRAFKRLRKGLLRQQTLDGTESYVLLAIAAQATQHSEELEQALKAARDNGADLTLLGSPQP
jgi:aminopeptidase N